MRVMTVGINLRWGFAETPPLSRFVSRLGGAPWSSFVRWLYQAEGTARGIPRYHEGACFGVLISRRGVSCHTDRLLRVQYEHLDKHHTQPVELSQRHVTGA